MFDDLASCADPYPAYAELREHGVHCLDDGRWVVARAADVVAVLADPAAQVESRRSGHDRLDDVRSLMARFSNGEDHARRRTVAADAIAGLTSTNLAWRRRAGDGDDVASLVREANRWDPPVQHTTRIAVADLTIGGRVIGVGERIVVLVAAANRDPDAVRVPDEFRPGRVERGLGFGSGAHACPGESIALASAAGIVTAVLAAGRLPATIDVHYERRPNLRIPADLVLTASA